MSYEKEIDHFVTESEEVVGLKDTYARERVHDIVNPDIRLIAAYEGITVPDGQDRVYVTISQDIDGNPLREEEVVIEISASTYLWSYVSVSIDTPEGTISLGGVDDTNSVKVIHIRRVGMRYIAECQGFRSSTGSSTKICFSGIFSGNNFEPKVAPYITGITIGPFTSVSMKVYAKLSLKSEVI